MTAPLWQILIPTIAHRHGKLRGLLRVLDAQMQPGVRVTVWRDNLEHSYAEKLQGLYDSATAEYVSSLADDDSVAPDFIPRCLEAMETSPDYVGFRVLWTEAGVPGYPVRHSLACGGWYDTILEVGRDLMYYNPVRREHAQLVRFRGTACDREWADDLRATGAVQAEVFIDAEMLYYRHDTADDFYVPRQPLPANEILPLPSYPWLDVLTG
jgi:hypothetical protein